MFTRLLCTLVLVGLPQAVAARALPAKGGAPRGPCRMPKKALPLALRYREETRRRFVLARAVPAPPRQASPDLLRAAARPEPLAPPRPAGRALRDLLESLLL